MWINFDCVPKEEVHSASQNCFHSSSCKKLPFILYNFFTTSEKFGLVGFWDPAISQWICEKNLICGRVINMDVRGNRGRWRPGGAGLLEDEWEIAITHISGNECGNVIKFVCSRFEENKSIIFYYSCI